MIEKGVGGSNTKTGLIFEGKTDLKTFLNNQQGYVVNDKNEVFFNNELVAYLFKKNKLYKYLDHCGINWNDYLSKNFYLMMQYLSL